MEEDSEINTEENYYTFLNVPKNATSEQISSAYRNLSRIYHPDKHTNDDKKEQAEMLFNRTKKAYEILSDPHKRVIYDCLGMKGLETEGWEIVQKTRTPAEIREEYERLAREREQRKLQQRTNPKGSITININATNIFNSYDDNDYNEFSLSKIEISGMSISQSIDAPITTRDTVVLSGNLSTSNGVGSGGFEICSRRLINKGWFELDVGAGNGGTISFKGSKNLSPKVFCNGGVNVNFRQNGVIAGFVGTLAVQLNKHTIGYLTYNAGIQSSMSTVIERTTDNTHMAVNVTIGIPHCFIFASYTRKFSELELKVRVATKVGTFGFLAEYGADKRISKYSSIGATVVFGVPSGVTLKLKLVRSTQSFIFPIHLSEEVIPAAVFYATVTPLLGWLIIKKLIIEPMNAEKKQRDIDKVKEVNKIRMQEQRMQADAAVSLMSATYERICDEEERKDGLIIIKAIYGNLKGDSNLNDAAIYMIDVTIPLQCLIKDSKLFLYNSNKSELPGFYDPCVGEDKYLRIEYIYRKNNYTIQIADKDPVKIPQTENL